MAVNKLAEEDAQILAKEVVLQVVLAVAQVLALVAALAVVQALELAINDSKLILLQNAWKLQK